MLFLLILLMFNADGSKSAQLKVEATEQQCSQDAAALVAALKAARPPELIGIGVQCDGPLDDPTVKKSES